MPIPSKYIYIYIYFSAQIYVTSIFRQLKRTNNISLLDDLCLTFLFLCEKRYSNFKLCTNVFVAQPVFYFILKVRFPDHSKLPRN